MGAILCTCPKQVFVFADGGVQFFESAQEAAQWVEAIDVEAGEYSAFVRLDAELLDARIVDQTRVILEASGRRDRELLVGLLESARTENHTFSSDPADPETVADELRVAEWEARWPKGLAGQTTARRGA